MWKLLLCLTPFVVLTCSQLISIPLQRMKTPRQQMAEVGSTPEDLLYFGKPKPKPKTHNDSVALFKFLDSEFYGLVSFGHPVQTFRVVFDTSWSNTWIPSAQCSKFSIPCLFHNKYNSKASTTYEPNGTEFKVDFGKAGTLKGVLSTDVFHISHLSLKNITFAEVTEIPLSFMFNKADGILGLGFSKNAIDDVTPIFYSLVKQGVIVEPVFSFYFNRDHTSTRGGNLYLGGSDPKHYNGTFTYLPVTERLYWKIKMDRLLMDKGNKTIPFCSSGCDVILDTSTITITAPVNTTKKINTILGETTEWFGRSKVPCNLIQKLPPFSFIFAGKPFKLEAHMYIQKVTVFGITVCLSPFVAAESDDNEWVIGGAFISQYYTEFDLGRNRVGFALAR